VKSDSYSGSESCALTNAGGKCSVISMRIKWQAGWSSVATTERYPPSIKLDPFFFMYPLAGARCRGGLFWLGDLRLCG
jgi:hypothetical protein